MKLRALLAVMLTGCHDKTREAADDTSASESSLTDPYSADLSEELFDIYAYEMSQYDVPTGRLMIVADNTIMMSQYQPRDLDLIINAQISPSETPYSNVDGVWSLDPSTVVLLSGPGIPMHCTDDPQGGEHTTFIGVSGQVTLTLSGGIGSILIQDAVLEPDDDGPLLEIKNFSASNIESYFCDLTSLG